MIPTDSWWLPMLADVSARVTVILALAWLVARVAFHRSASTRHAVWAAAFMAALALPVVARMVPAWPLALLPASDSRAEQARPLASLGPLGSLALSGADTSFVLVNVAPPAITHIASTTGTSSSAAWSVAPLATLQNMGLLGWALIAWAVVAGALLLRYVLSLAAVSALTRQAAAVKDWRWIDALDVASASLGIVRTPRLLISDRAAVPFTCGFFKPALIVPEGASSWSDERIHVVLLHELAHVARRDCLVQAIAQAVCAMYWFHPLTWVGARHLRAERERACDDLVLASGTRGATYAEHLLDIARSASMATPRLATAALAMARASELEGRLLAILDPRRDRGRIGRGLLWQVALASLAVALPLASVRLVARDQAAAATDATSTATATKETPATHVGTTGVAGGLAEGVRAGVAGGVGKGVSGGVGIGVGQGTGQREAPEAQEAETGKPLSPTVLAALTEALKDSDAEVRKSAMQALARFQTPASFNAFMTGLKDPDAEVREQAAFALSQLKDTRATDALVAALKDENDEVRQQAAFALSQLRDPRAVPGLTAALKDPSDEVREQALFALSQLRDPSTLPALIVALSDSKANVREQAAFALSQLGDDRAVPALIGALKDKEPEVRAQAAFALSHVGNDSAIEPLTAAMKDPVAEVRQQAIFALSQIAGGERQHHGPPPRAVVAPSSGVAPPAPAGASAPTPTPAPRPRV